MKRAAAAALAAVLACALGAGCRIHLEGPKRAFKPEGETATVELSKRHALTGEFLGLRGDSLVLLREGRLVEVPLASLNRVKIEGYPSVEAQKRDALQRYARYPQGLSEERWAEVLQRHGQSTFDAPPAP